MPNLNKIVLAGYLVRDPERRSSGAGVPVGSFTMATNHYYLDRAGQRQQETAFVPCAAFGAAANWLMDRKKGAALIVSGRLRTESWLKDGHQASRLVLVCDSVQFLDGKRGRPEEEQSQTMAAQGQEKAEDPVPF